MDLRRTLLLIIFFLGVTGETFAQVKKDTLNILFVGNSYTYTANMPHLVSLISDSTHVKLLTQKSTVGGARLSDHWNGKKGLQTKALIQKGSYDIVVLQEHSMGTIDRKAEFMEYTKKFCKLIKQTGAKPYLYVTWGRERVPQYQETITKVYQQAAKENECGIVAVGEAWKLARTLRPDLKMFMPDGSHPSDIGAFLTACVFAGTFTGEMPDKLPNTFSITDARGESVMLLWENSLDITFCRKVASEFILKKQLK